MSALTILYATDDITPRLTDSRAARGWEVICPVSLNEALAMAVYYVPHAVVIDGDSPWLNELAEHLTEVTGPSPRMQDIILRISGTPLFLETPEFIVFRELPTDTTSDDLADIITSLNDQRTRLCNQRLTLQTDAI